MMPGVWSVGPGLSAGLNVLPKTAWYTSYSNNITREMNKTFLKGLHKIWFSYGLLSDTANLDFTTILIGETVLI